MTSPLRTAKQGCLFHRCCPPCRVRQVLFEGRHREGVLPDPRLIFVASIFPS